MHCLLEIHSERKIFQYSMKSALSLMRIMSVTQGDPQIVVIKMQTTHYREYYFKSRSINAWNLYQRNLKTDLIT